mmetsp:Transcript_30179/g.72429  ORF Transcript_30179/g.72429 Transcript_30179/m.72429 type:complete len:224 (+) Transcript_30179:1213-1884(+)
MTMIAAVAMTELFGKASRSVETSKGAVASAKRKFHKASKAQNKESRRVAFRASPGMERVKSRIPSAVCVFTPQSRRLTMNHHTVAHGDSRYPHLTHRLQKSPAPFPYHLHPQRPSSTYDDVIKSSGLPKTLSFRKICSRCGRARGEHSELGFGNKCVFDDCGKCHAAVEIHKQYGSPMGIMCCLSVEEGATPGQVFRYERKIRDLSARAKLLKSLKHDKREAS